MRDKFLFGLFGAAFGLGRSQLAGKNFWIRKKRYWYLPLRRGCWEDSSWAFFWSFFRVFRPNYKSTKVRKGLPIQESCRVCSCPKWVGCRQSCPRHTDTGRCWVLFERCPDPWGFWRCSGNRGVRMLSDRNSNTFPCNRHSELHRVAMVKQGLPYVFQFLKFFFFNRVACRQVQWRYTWVHRFNLIIQNFQNFINLSNANYKPSLLTHIHTHLRAWTFANKFSKNVSI